MRGRESAVRVLIVLLSLILIIPLASNSTSADSDGIELAITIEEPNFDSSWYNENETLVIDIKIHNSGSSTQSIEYNPSCPVEIEMLDGNGELFSNLHEHRACQQQRRGIDIPAGQTRSIDNFEWDWKNSSGETIIGGSVTINFNFESGRALYSQIIEFQQNPITIDGLMLEVSTASAPRITGEEFFAGEKIYSHLSLKNVDDTPLLLDVDEGCRVTLQASSLGSSLPTIMTDLSCGKGIIEVGESLSLGWLNWDFTQSGEQLLPGIWTLDIGLTGISDVSSTVFATLSGSNEFTDTTLLEMEVNVLGDVGNDGIITDADTIEIDTSLTNLENIPVDIQFNNSCLVAIHLISSQGAIVGNTRITDGCDSTHSEIKVSPSTTHQLEQRYWQMVDQFGCELNDDNYMMVVTIPEFGLLHEIPFIYDGSNTGLECRASMQDTSSVNFNVIGLITNNADTAQESVTFQLDLDNQDELNFYWPQNCQLEFTLQKVGSSHPQQVWLEECGSGSGLMGTIPAGHGISYNPFTVEFAELDAGTWRLTARTTGTPSFTTQWAHTWNPPIEPVQENENNDDTVDEVNETPGVIEELVPKLSWLAEGNWDYVTTESGGCWILVDLNGVEHAFTASNVENWVPRTNIQGAYWVEETSESTSACTVWDSLIIVDDVLGEKYVEQSAEEETTEVSEATPIISIPATAPAIVTVIASTSLLALLAGSLVQVEWIRLPATKYGLFLLGMVRKNREKGGEYQRGRIVAYIELHRGIHFRALLAALDMSNGQLAHHLSVLEGDEAIWRRKDGRKVRYYPASIDSSVSNDELPVPVLTPDPNSLQGKILQILDIHENEILNLSQKELSVKLETSQQLVSYHLKSLENWGLVEKERVALRYRYRLTDRALILLNTSELLSLGDDA